jgi:predicted GTPase
MDKASTVMAAGADFKLMGTKSTMIKSSKPVISVCAIRTGVGKSQTTRAVVENLKKLGKKVCVIRHPMPYGDLYEQKCQRYEKLSDMDKHKCTIEEREEYENHILAGTILYAGVDYEEIIRSAEKECDVILWDGGNNDWSFYVPDLALTLVDPHRPGHELTYYPGSTNTKMGHVVIMSKSNTAKKEDIATVEKNCKQANPSAKFIQADSTITCEQSDKLKGKKVVVVEDGPTLTHGEMKYGAGIIAAQNSGAVIVDPAKFAVGTIKSTLEKYTHIQKLLPAMGYGDKQIKDLEDSINSIDCDYVICGTPIDLSKVIKINKPVLRVNYDYKDNGELEAILKNFVAKHC